jgi:hypothetical protein
MDSASNSPLALNKTKLLSMEHAHADQASNTTVSGSVLQIVKPIKFWFWRVANVFLDLLEIPLVLVSGLAQKTKSSSVEYVDACLDL